VATIVIKKYGNRRLYDTGDSRYITLEELAAKMRAGADVRVVDAQTGEDLTQSTLVQLVLETGNAAKFLPVQLLTQMVRLSDDALADFFSRYVTMALEMYLQAKSSMMALNPLGGLSAFWPGGASSPYVQARGTPPTPGSVPQPAPPLVNPPPLDPEDLDPDRKSSPSIQRGDDVAAMRRELEELKQAVREGFGANRAQPRRKRKP
jgi:polyhydroxyalkanoate synthesis repressor PhaR